MKKVVLGLSLALAALGLIASPAMAAPDSARPAPSAADQAFLSTLATPAPVLVGKGPAGKTVCNVTANCANGGTVFCSGSSSCSGVDGACPEAGHVTCDGVTSWCSPCPCSLNCAAERANCVVDCGTCPIIFSCSTSTCTFSCRCRITQNCLL